MSEPAAARIAVVTGASGGIGSVIAQQLSEAGYHVIAHYSHNEERARQLRQKIRAKGRPCTLVAADLTSNDAPQRIFDAVDAVMSADPRLTLSALVNNAGLLLGPSFADATSDQFDSYLAVNTKAPFFLSQQAATRMNAGSGIVNISSAGAHFPSPGDIVYAMSKAALEAFTFHAAASLAPRGIRVNTVIPGFTDNGHPAFHIKEVRQHMASHAALGGVSAPETVAKAVAFLLSDEASRTTGATLDVSGGSTLGSRTPSTFSLKSIAANVEADMSI